MAFYTLPPFLIPNVPDPDATPEEIQEWREQIGAFLRQNARITEELGEAYIGQGAQLADLVVGTAKIDSAAITSAKIANLAVTTTKIDSAAITTAKIIDLAVTTAKIEDLNVTGGKIAAGAITADKIQAGTITAAEIESGTITGDLIAADTITVSNLTVANFDNVVENPSFELTTAAGSLTSPGWTTTQSGWVFTTALASLTGNYKARYTGTADAATLTADNVVPVSLNQEWYAECYIRPSANNTTGAAQVLLVWLDADQVFLSQDGGNTIDSAGSSYTKSSIAAVAPTDAAYVLIRGRVVTAPSSGGSLRFDDFYARRKLGGAYIEDASIVTAHIQDAQITTAKIADAQISTAKIIDLAVTGAKIADATITTAKIGSLQVTGPLIANSTITAAKIAAGTITAAEIAAGAITTVEIAAGTITGSNIDAATITGDLIAAGTIAVENLIVTNIANMLENPGFEDALSVGWTQSSGTWTRSTALIRSGARCLVNGTISTGAHVLQNNVTATVGGSEEYVFEGYVRSGGTISTGNARLRITFRDSAGTGLQSNDSALFTSGSSYTLLTASGTAPTSASSVTFAVVVTQLNGASPNYRFDDLFAARKAGTAHIQDAAITTALIADAQITTAKIADAQISSAKIIDAAITTAKIGSAQITTAKIANLQITNALIADATITASKLVADTITANEIAANTITASEIAAATITGTQIAAATITGTLIDANTISANNLIIGNYDNVVENPGFEQGAVSWTLGTGFIVSTSLARNGAQCAAYTATADGGLVTITTAVPVVPGQEWYAECWSRRGANDTVGAAGQVLLVWLDTAGSFLSQDQGNNVSGTSYQQSFIAADAPTDAAYVLVRGRASTGPTSGSFVRFDDFYARRRIGTAFIEDAAITAAKIEDATITTAKIANATILGANIANATIENDLIVNGTITGTKIDAETITVSNLTVANFDNVLENPSFEAGAHPATSAIGWTIADAGWLFTTSLAALHGEVTARYTGTVATQLTNANIAPTKAGDVWYAECWIRPSNANTTGAGRMQVFFRDTAGTLLAAGGGTIISSAGSSYAISAVSATAPANAATIEFRGRVVSPPSSGGSLRFDAFYARRKLGTAYIENAAVTTALIADAAITTAKIGNLQVDTAQIASAAITSGKIDSLAVITAKIDSAAITSAKIADLAVTTAKINSAAITTAKIDDLAVTNGKIGNLAVDTAQIANLAVETLQIGSAQVTSSKRQNVSSFSQSHTAVSELTSVGTQKTHSLGKVPNTTISRTSYTGTTVLPFIDDADTSVFWMYSNNVRSAGGDLSITWVAYYW